MSIASSQPSSLVVVAGANVKTTVANAGGALQVVVAAITAMQALEAYNSTTSAADRTLLNGISTTAANIISQINGIAWTY